MSARNIFRSPPIHPSVGEGGPGVEARRGGEGAEAELRGAGGEVEVQPGEQSKNRRRDGEKGKQSKVYSVKPWPHLK